MPLYLLYDKLKKTTNHNKRFKFKFFIVQTFPVFKEYSAFFAVKSIYSEPHSRI